MHGIFRYVQKFLISTNRTDILLETNKVANYARLSKNTIPMRSEYVHNNFGITFFYDSSGLEYDGFPKCLIYSQNLVTYLADANEADGDVPIAPNPTPTANPSGTLCTVIAIISNSIRFHCLESVTSGGNCLIFELFGAGRLLLLRFVLSAQKCTLNWQTGQKLARRTRNYRIWFLTTFHIRTNPKRLVFSDICRWQICINYSRNIGCRQCSAFFSTLINALLMSELNQKIN